MGRPFNMFVSGFLAAVALVMVMRGDALLALLNASVAVLNLRIGLQPKPQRRDA